MQKEYYGKIVNGELVMLFKNEEGAKPVVFEDIPDFDQSSEAVFQGVPVDEGDYIFVPCLVVVLDDVEEGMVD